MWSNLVSYLRGRRILVWGFGTEGASSASFLQRHLPGQSFVITDSDPARVQSILYNDRAIEFLSEVDALTRLSEFDLILKSPGISLLKFRFPPNVMEKIRGQSDLFLQFAPGHLIGVTGTKGKSTTSSLIAHLLQTQARSTPLVGNIGVPPWNVIKNLDDESICVIELSSYQLEGTRYSPKIAVLLNLYQEHLNYHGSLEAYWRAKWNITLHQKPGDTLIYNESIPEIVTRVRDRSGVSAHAFGLVKPFQFSLEGCLALRGNHNLSNAQAAVLTAKGFGVSDETVQKRLLSYKGLPHRLEFVGVCNEITYYNDSISTVPESAMAALAALSETETIILGGQNRGVDYTQLAEVLRASQLSTIILVSETGEILRDLLMPDSRIRWVHHLTEAMQIAKRETRSGGTCLFSPAAPSYNQFQNFEERGNLFKQLTVT